LAVDVKDRFGSYGLTGVAIFRCGAGALTVDTFLLSCRALGRGVEHRMVARLGEIARERGLSRVEIPFVSGQRNRPAAMFLESIGAKPTLTAEAAADIKYAPSAPSRSRFREEPSHRTATVRERTAPPKHRVPYLKIATDLRTPAAILERIHAATRKPARPASEPPRTPLEKELAQLWAGLLN